MITDLPNEEWRAIRGYNGKYFISNKGRVKSLKRGAPRILAQQINNSGYLRVSLSQDGEAKYFSVHRLVAIYFVFNDDPLEKNTVDHIDGNKQNNNAENLRWLSLSDNVKAYYNKMKEGKEHDDV